MKPHEKLLRPPSLTDAVVSHIRSAVIDGRYQPGEQLAEATLAQTLGTSRGTVREAMRVLANLGLVSLTAHRSATVTMLTADRAREIYTLRALLESYAARMAAEEGKLDTAAIAMLELRHSELMDAAEGPDVAAMIDADMRFHQALSSLSGHRLLLEHLNAIQTDSRRFLTYSDLYRPDAAEVVRRHSSLLDTIRTQDPEAIERVIRDHISDVSRDIVARMSTPAQTDGPSSQGSDDGADGADGARPTRLSNASWARQSEYDNDADAGMGRHRDPGTGTPSAR